MENIKNIARKLELRYKNKPKKLNTELELLKDYIQASEFYMGKKKKLYKFINRKKIK